MNDKVVLENKLACYQDEVSTLKAMVTSLELEKVGLVDRKAMLVTYGSFYLE